MTKDLLPLLSPAAHHFISSTLGNQERLIAKEGAPTLRIHPLDAEARGIRSGQMVRVSNERGWCRLVAEVTEDVRVGVLARRLSGGRSSVLISATSIGPHLIVWEILVATAHFIPTWSW